MLEEAILDAAYAELDAHGYAGLTMEGVAVRAGTSRPVLARRWETRADLAVAAIRRQMSRHPITIEDMGSVRAELLELLERASERARTSAAMFTLFAAAYFGETGTSPQGLREALIKGETDALKLVLDRAVARGEIDERKLVPPVTTLLYDLFRSQAIMTFAAPPVELRQAWVDTLFLPLVSPTTPGQGAARSKSA
ncbi:TetR family transcriptional regulator [Devosia pacifica]|uniref:TetR family transcriptional regulator n=1 Tax=Devosia pacifica TaxID=1335967 RepID=A0A918SF34_9HYPH|nr:TetR family transcriptional regulator [Devosia pacifica]